MLNIWLPHDPASVLYTQENYNHMSTQKLVHYGHSGIYNS